MLQPRSGLDLAQETLRAERVGKIWVQHLEGDQPIVPEVAGEIDRGHTTTAELALEQVAVGQCSPKTIGSGTGQLKVLRRGTRRLACRPQAN
jgi:hypothetical protein